MNRPVRKKICWLLAIVLFVQPVLIRGQAAFSQEPARRGTSQPSPRMSLVRLAPTPWIGSCVHFCDWVFRLARYSPTDAGLLAVAPERAVLLAETPRYAWWQIDPRSGHTIAATDEGLHQTSSEADLVIVDETDPSVTVVSVWSTESLSVVVYEVLPGQLSTVLGTLGPNLQIMFVF